MQVLATPSSLTLHSTPPSLPHTEYSQLNTGKRSTETMEAARKLLTVALLLALLLAVTGEMMGAPALEVEARTCLSQSHRFRGPCVRRSNCANVCKTEGFPDGKCRGFRRRCFCVTNCHHH